MTPGVGKSSQDFSSWILYSPLRPPLLRWQELFLAQKMLFLSVQWKTKYSSSPAPKPVFTDVQRSRYLILFLTPWIWYSCRQWHRPSVVQHSAADRWCWARYWSTLFKPGVLSGGIDLVTKPREPCPFYQLTLPALLNYLSPFSPAQASKQRQILRDTCLLPRQE